MADNGIVIRRYPWVVSVGFANTTQQGLLTVPAKSTGLGGTSTPGQPQQYAHGISNLQLNLDLYDPSTCSFHLPAYIPNPRYNDFPETEDPLILNPAYKYLVKGFTDCWVYRDGVGMFRGRLTRIQENFGLGAGVTLSFVDYRGLLDKVSGIDPAFTYANMTQEDLILKVIQNSETNSPLGLTKGNWTNSTVLLDGTVSQDVSAWQVLQQITQLDLGVDLDIDMNNHVNLYYPGKGTNNGVTLDYNGLITDGSADSDVDGYSNVVRQYAGTYVVGTNKGKQVPPGLYFDQGGIDTIGRWFTASAPPTPALTTDTARDAYGKAQLRKLSNLDPSFQMTFAMGGWKGPNHVNLGDPVQVSTPEWALHHLKTPYQTRVVGMTINVDANLNESVTMEMGKRKKDFTKQLKAFAAKYKGDALQTQQQTLIDPTSGGTSGG